MKNIIERIAGGAKIARYLPKAVSTRLAIAALAALAAGGAWATDSLEETGGFVTETSTLAFKGMTLDEITATTLHGRIGGGWMSGKVGNPWGFYVFDRSVTGQMKCEAQINDSGTIKGVRLVFTQSGDDVYVATDGTGAAAMRYKSGATLGESLFVDGTTTPSGNGSDTAYRVYNLSLTRTWSDSAVVLWEAGQFGVTSKTGSDGNTYTLNANGNSVAANASSITINQSVGVKVDSSAALTSGMTVLVRYSDLNLSLGSAQTLVNSSIDSNGTAAGDDNGNRTGVYIDSSGASQGLWAGKTCTSANGVSQTSHTFVATETSGVMAFSYYSASTTDSNLGTHLWYLSNGTRSALYNLKTLGSTSDSSIYGCVIGGPRGSTTNGGPATGMKITGIAIFKGVLTDSQMTSFVWPSAVAAEYNKWNYAAAGRVVTWKSLPDASLDSGTGQKITVAGTTYGVFDTYSGSDNGTIYSGGATSSSGAYWNYFCTGKSVYSAPGSVMRFIASDTYAHNVRADFSPLTIGGIIVESGATGYSLAEDASNANKDNRAVILGDHPASGQETWFRFNENFTFGRQGALALVGSVNIEIADGKTLSVTEKSNNSSEKFVPKVCSSIAVKSDGSGALSTLTGGGALRLHGAGKFVSTAGLDASGATLDYTDLSATSSTAAGAYIQGTLTVNRSTVIALPADATFPYFIATGISGVLDSETGVTIGGVAAPNYNVKADGSIIYIAPDVAPAEVTISSDATWGSGDLDGWSTDDITKSYVINVTANSTLAIPSAISLNKVTFNVAEGVALTLSGAYAITAASAIHVNGLGKVITAAADSFAGVIKGDGTVQYPSKTLPAGAIWTNNDWEGTLIIVQCGKTNNDSHGYIDFASYGSVNSFIKATLFAGYTTQSATANATYCAATLVIDEGDTFTLNDGDGSKSCVFKALTGSGTLALSGSGTATTQYIFRDVSGFTGTVTISDDANKSIVLGASSSWTPDFTSYQKKLVIAGDVTIAAGKTWTANGGIVNNGTIALNGALSGTVTGSGTIVCGQSVDLSGSGFDNSANWTGTVRLNGDATAVPSTFYDETFYGNASSTLEIASGSVAITAAKTLPGTVNVASSASLFVTSSATELTLAGSNSGTINLSMASALTTLNLNLTGNGSIVYPSSLTTLNVTYTESLADDGVKAFTVNGATFAGGTMTLTRPDGTTESVTGTADGNTLSFEWTPAVSGAACWIAYEMDYASGNANKTGFENSGSDNSGLNSDNDIEGSDAFTDDGMLYTYAHPWRNMTGNNAYPSSWTAVVRCTVPAYENAAVITFGTKDGGLIGLVAGANPETQMRLVQTTGNSHFVTNATMTVQNATTAQHVYIFSVENNQTVKVYCDGDQVLNKTFDSQFTIGGGIQVGSVHGGIGSTGIVRFGKGESPANTLSETVQKAARIDCVRLYKTVLGQNAIAALTEEFPAVKLYRATVAADATTTWDALTWSPAWDGGNEYSKIILTAAGDGTLTLPESIKADEFIVNIAADSTLTLAKASGGSAMTVSKLEINDGKVAVADANFFGSRVINGTGTLKITAIGTLTSALSGNAKFEIPSGVGVGVMSGGSIANAITGAGELAYQNPADVPATSLTFSAWTGTVSLPIVNASNGVNFNNYGVSGSTVALKGITGGYILGAGRTVNPTLRLDGAMNITAMSSWTYTFAEITGSGNLSFSTSANSPTVNITKVAEGYSGTISSTLGNPVTIATLDRAADATVTPGSKVLSTSSGVQASALTVGGEATGIVPVFDTDGLYVKAASVTKNNATTYHNTVADALTAAGSDAATITLLAPTDNAITIAPGQTLVNGNLTTGSVTGPDGYEVVNNNGTYTLVDNTASTWSPGENSDNNWSTAANWSTGYLPSQYTVVTFPESESAHVVKLTLNNANSEAERHRCASMVLNGDVTFQRANSGTWAYVFVYGNVTGTGTLTFEQTGLNTPANSSIAVSCPVVGNAASNDNFFSGSGATYTFSAAVDIAAREFKADYANLVFNGPVTIRNGGYVKSNGEGASATFNGGINVLAGASASLTVNGGSQHTIASTVTLGAGATFTIPTATTVSGATFTAASGYDVVHSTSGDNTVYTTELKGATVNNVAVSYGADYTSATVTATVSDATLDYYISWASGEPVKGTVSGSTVTFDVSGIAHTEPYQSSGYNISAKDGETTVTTTGGSGESVAADVAANWINENATTHGQQAAGGSWTNAEAVTYSEGKAAITDNRFEATTASTASRVVLEFNVCFSSVSDADVDGTAQAAIKLGESGGATTFMVLASNAAWTPVSRGDFVPDASATYKVVMTIDYGNGSYGVTVGDNVLTNASGSASFPLAKSGATSVKNIDFAGSGTLMSMKGDQVEGYMVKDNAGHWYATIQAATQAYNSANGPYTVLHDGTAPSGWKIDETTKALIKLAKGFFFMAY